MHSQCPHCQSSFDIPPAALEAAEGIVRCGQCMQLFDANAHSVEAHTEQLSDAATANHVDEDKSEVDAELASEEQQLLDEADDGALATDPIHEDADRSLSEVDSTQDDSLKDSDTFEASTETQISEEIELSEEEARPSTSIEPPDGDDVIGLSIESESLFTSEIEMGQISADGEANDDDFAFFQSAANEEAETLSDVDARDNVHDHSGADEAFDKLRETQAELDSLAADKSGRETTFAVIPPPEPLSGSRHKHRRSSGEKIRLFAGAFMALILLSFMGLQWFSAYNETKQWPLVAKLCELIYCKSGSGSSSFESIERVIHSHPDKPGALVLKTTLINSAKQPLPFPHLALEFSDLQDQPLARRVFSPEEYLSQSLLDDKAGILPHDTPIEIEIEIADPGKDAVNYSLSYFLPTS